MHSKGHPHLNFDTLRLVCNCLTNVSDVLSFALTCSTLKNDAFKRRLQMSPIVLSSPEAVDKFYDFIFADTTSRAPHIYGLKLPDLTYTTERVVFLLHGLRLPNSHQNAEADGSLPSTINGRLVAILEGAIHLEHLSLSTTGLEDPLLAIVAKISTLRELFLRGRYHRGPFLKLLTTLRAPLRHLHIEEYITGDITAGFLHNSLSHFAPTLEVLELADFPLDISPSSVTTQFPAMRSLKAELVYSFEDLGLLLHLFPNLDDTLVIKALSPNGNDFPDFRQRSKEAQRAHTWPSLDRVVCTAKGAFLLALQCPIRRMDLEGPISRQEEKQCLVEVLRHNSPRRLSFRLEVFRGLDTLDGLFPVEGADKLTHLVLCLSVQVERREGYISEHNSPWDRFNDTLLDSIKHLRLTHLRLVFQYEVCRDRDDVSAAPHGTSLSTSEGDSLYHASEEDLHPTATRLFGTMPSLQYTLLTTCGYTTLLNRTRSRRHTSRWFSSKAWRITNAPKDLSASVTERGPCVEMSNDEAEAVINREELHLGSREQAMVAFCGSSLSN